MKLLSTTAIAIILTGLVGCNLTNEWPKTDQSNRPEVVVAERAPAAEIWLSLAHAVEAGVIETPHELAQYVRALRESGDLSQADEDVFDGAFKDAPTDHRELNKSSDSQTLRGLK